MSVGKLLFAAIIGVCGLGTTMFVLEMAEQSPNSAITKTLEPSRDVVSAMGVVTSETLPFLEDQRTQEVLSQQPYWLSTDVNRAPSRQMSQRSDLEDFDFVLPSGAPSAQTIQNKLGIEDTYQVFYTPMVVASWKPVLDILMQNGMAGQDSRGYYYLDMEKLIEVMAEGKRWTDLKSSELYPARKPVLMATPDVRTSNSAAMYLSIVSYVLNDRTVVRASTPFDITRLSELFLQQGFTEKNASLPFQDYLTMGPGKAPMVMIYESQYLREAIKPNSPITDEMVLIYPKPTIFSKSVLIPMGEEGESLGKALTRNPELQQKAAAYGFRSHNMMGFLEFYKERGIHPPGYLIDIIDPPSPDVLENLINGIEGEYQMPKSLANAQ